MACLSEHHKPKAGVVGKCSVPMWCGGLPAGFCDQSAYGEQRAERYRGENLSYASGYCCAGHGGPRENDVRFMRDGDMWMAFNPGFVNLQESPAGFGETRAKALAELSAPHPTTGEE